MQQGTSPNIRSCADDDTFAKHNKSTRSRPSGVDPRLCQKCRNTSGFLENSVEFGLAKGPVKPISQANAEANRKVIINTNFNFPKKGELEVLMDKSMHVNESFSLSVVYQNFENEINGKADSAPGGCGVILETQIESPDKSQLGNINISIIHKNTSAEEDDEPPRKKSAQEEQVSF